jgi:hypothetical protein
MHDQDKTWIAEPIPEIANYNTNQELTENSRLIEAFDDTSPQQCDDQDDGQRKDNVCKGVVMATPFIARRPRKAPNDHPCLSA